MYHLSQTSFLWLLLRLHRFCNGRDLSHKVAVWVLLNRGLCAFVGGINRTHHTLPLSNELITRRVKSAQKNSQVRVNREFFCELIRRRVKSAQKTSLFTRTCYKPYTFPAASSGTLRWGRSGASQLTLSCGGPCGGQRRRRGVGPSEKWVDIQVREKG